MVVEVKWVHIKANLSVSSFKNNHHHQKETEVVNALLTSELGTKEERGANTKIGLEVSNTRSDQVETGRYKPRTKYERNTEKSIKKKKKPQYPSCIVGILNCKVSISD